MVSGEDLRIIYLIFYIYTRHMLSIAKEEVEEEEDGGQRMGQSLVAR